jgi:2-methylcitrate dehydratase
LVRVASTAVVAKMLAGSRDQIVAALSQAWIDGGALRTYRHAPNTGSRKSWAAGDATSRAVRLALLSIADEMGYPTALSAPHWGFQHALFRKQSIRLARPLESYVMENILFKVSFPAEFHGQTAVEAAIGLHAAVADRLDQIERILIETTEPAVRTINKTGPLRNPADRDHCLQYMVAIGLLYGTLTADHYEDAVADRSEIDSLRERMQVVAKPSYSHDYLDPDKRSIANAIQIFFERDQTTDRVEVEYPLGHRRRRAEAEPLLLQKFQRNMATRLSTERVAELTELFADSSRLDSMPVDEFVDLLLPDNED